MDTGPKIDAKVQQEVEEKESKDNFESENNVQDKYETLVILSQEDVDKSKTDLEKSQKQEKSLEESLVSALQTIEELKLKVQELEVRETRNKSWSEGKAEGIAEAQAEMLENAKIKVLEFEYKELKSEMENLKIQLHNLDLESARQNSENAILAKAEPALPKRHCRARCKKS